MENLNVFGGDSIEKNCFDKIREILLSGKTVLELGSGNVTKQLANHYKMISIEHDPNWLNKYNSTYIHAPLVKYNETDPFWYDTKVLKKELSKHNYDLILVDGPPAVALKKKNIRIGFFNNLQLFNTNCPMIFDDMQPGRLEKEMMLKVARKLNRKYEIIKGKTHHFAVMP